MWKIVQKIRRLFSPKDKKRLILVTGLMTLAAFGEMLGIGLLIGVIALFLSPTLLEKSPLLKSFFEWTHFSWNTFVVLSVSLVGLGLVLKNVFSLFVVYMQSKFIFDKQNELSVRMFRTYLNAPYRFSLDHTLSERSVNVSRALQLSMGVLLPLMQIISDGLVIFVLGSVMVYFIPWIALSSLLFMLATGYLIYWVTRTANIRMGKGLQLANLSMGAALHTGLAGIKAVKALCREDFFTKGFETEQKKVVHFSMWLYTMGQFPRLMLEIAAMLLLLGVFVVMLLSGKSSNEILLTFTMIVAAMARILPALSRCNYNFTTIRQSQYMFDFVMTDLFEIKPEPMGTATEPLTLEKELEIKDLTFSYDGKNNVLEHFSLNLPANRSLGISGKTGCGKTTLVDILLGLLRPAEGTILADGQDIYSNLRSWRGLIGYVSQNIYVSSASVKENVAFGVPPEEIDEERVWDVLKLAQLADWVKLQPGQLDYPLKDSGTNLSGGQRQRIGIARALYLRPRLLVLDEATSALDNETETAFVDALEALNGKLTMIVIAHRLSTIAECDFQFCLRERK